MNDEKATIERDVWTSYFDRRKRELIKEGMSPEEADNAAFREVRREIHGSR